MKSVSPALATHLTGEATTLATLWRVVRRDGAVFTPALACGVLDGAGELKISMSSSCAIGGHCVDEGRHLADAAKVAVPRQLAGGSPMSGGERRMVGVRPVNYFPRREVSRIASTNSLTSSKLRYTEANRM